MSDGNLSGNALPRVYLQDGNCCIDFVVGTRIDADMVRHVYEQRRALAGDGPFRHKLLVTGNRVLAFDYGASKLSVSRHITESIIACAVVSESALERSLAALFTNLFKPPYPFRLFADRDSAARWLATLPAE